MSLQLAAASYIYIHYALKIFFYLFNAFLQSTPSGAISKSGDRGGLGEEVQ